LNIINNVDDTPETGQLAQAPKRELLLIAGIPGTGKTTFGDTLARDFGFLYYDLEEQQTLNRLASNPLQLIFDIVAQNRNVVVTWGFGPDDEPSIRFVLAFKASCFRVVRLDGESPGRPCFGGRLLLESASLICVLNRETKARC
jgi:hypothetical protein